MRHGVSNFCECFPGHRSAVFGVRTIPSMSVIHISRSGKTYRLHVASGRNGKDKFFFSTKPDGVLAEQIPDGFEIYETINSQVFLRRKTVSLIHEDELTLIQSLLDGLRGKSIFQAEIKKNMIVIHEADDSHALKKILAPWVDEAKVEALQTQLASYMPVMRFVLEQNEMRLFRPERFCFLGSVEDWIDLGCPEPLKKLAAKFLKHLGKDSLFELM